MQLKVISSCCLSLFVKLSSLHFLVKGIHFKRTHETTEQYYNYFKEMYDEVNERLVQKKELPTISLSEAIRLSKNVIKELPSNKIEYDTFEVYRECFNDFTTFISLLTNEINKCINNGDTVTEDILRKHKAYLAKEIWFLRAQLN